MSMSLGDWLRDSQGTSLLTNGDSTGAGAQKPASRGQFEACFAIATA
jgi:hypothetical protein